MNPTPRAGCLLLALAAVVLAVVSFSAGMVCLQSEDDFNCLVPAALLPAALLFVAVLAYSARGGIAPPPRAEQADAPERDERRDGGPEP